MNDRQKRLHTLLTDGAIAGLPAPERDELVALLEHGPLDPSYEYAAAAIELGLHPHTEPPPSGLEAALLDQASRYWGFTEPRLREPTLGGPGGEIMLSTSTGVVTWEPSDEHAMLEDSLTQGRIDRLEPNEASDSLRGDVLAPDLAGEVGEHARKRRYHAEVDAQLDRLQLQPSSDAPRPSKPKPKPAALEDDDDDLEDDDDLDDDDGDHDDEPPAASRRSDKPRKPQSRAEPRSAGSSNDYRLARWATGISAIASLVILTIALWLYTHRDAPDLDRVRIDVEASGDQLEWTFAAKPDDAVADQASGELVWSTTLQAGVMTLRGLEPNDPTRMQYQLWIVDRGRDGPPVDGGVFDVRSDVDPLELLIDAKLLIADPAAFVITVERPGGVVVSDQERVVFVAAPGS